MTPAEDEEKKNNWQCQASPTAGTQERDSTECGDDEHKAGYKPSPKTITTRYSMVHQPHAGGLEQRAAWIHSIRSSSALVLMCVHTFAALYLAVPRSRR